MSNVTFQTTYARFKPLQRRRRQSLIRLRELRSEIELEPYFKQLPITLFLAGSLGRLDSGAKSDLDLFAISDFDEVRLSRNKVVAAGNGIRRLDEYRLFAHLIRINEKLQYPEFSNDGQYLKVYKLDDLKSATGSPQDDSENLFTARMLLLLESQCLANQPLYDKCIDLIVDNYCRDEDGRQSFRPLFLLNDLLRYWRTLCLNYEQIRKDTERPWRKKNANLKFSRMLTVFATVLPLVTRTRFSAANLKALCRLTPIQRLVSGLELLGDSTLLKEFRVFLESYEMFLVLKEDERIKDALEPTTKVELEERAKRFARFLHKAVVNRRIDADYRRYLVI